MGRGNIYVGMNIEYYAMHKGAIKLRVMRAYSEKTVPSLIRLGSISPNTPYMSCKPDLVER